MNLVQLLINLLILCLIFGVIWYVISLLPLPPPFGLIIQVVMALILDPDPAGQAVLPLGGRFVGFPRYGP